MTEVQLSDGRLSYSILCSVSLHVAVLSAILLLSSRPENPIVIDVGLSLPTQILVSSENFGKDNFGNGKTLANNLQINQDVKVPMRSQLTVPANAIQSSVSDRTGDSTKINPLIDVEKQYALRLRAILEKRMEFPEAAKRMRITGRVSLRLHLNSMGKILSFGIAESSGKEILDQAALRLIDKIQEFPEFPSAISRRDWLFFIPIEYRN